MMMMMMMLQLPFSDLAHASPTYARVPTPCPHASCSPHRHARTQHYFACFLDSMCCTAAIYITPGPFGSRLRLT